MSPVRTVTSRGRCCGLPTSLHELRGQERPRAARDRPDLPTVLAHLSFLEINFRLPISRETYGGADDPDH